MSRSPYHRTSVDAEGSDSLAAILRLIPANSAVLDLGCSTGALGGALRERGCTVTGVDLDERDLAEASTRLAAVHRVDLDRDDLRSVLDGQHFDVVAAADVLEHLRRPERVLEQCRQLLAPSGVVVFSIPNVAHASVRLALWNGDFTYDETGLLDRTHVRMYTRRAVAELFDVAGFQVVQWSRTVADVEQGVPFDIRGVPRRAVRRMLASSDADTFQFVGVAQPREPIRGQELAADVQVRESPRRDFGSRLRGKAKAAAHRAWRVRHGLGS